MGISVEHNVSDMSDAASTSVNKNFNKIKKSLTLSLKTRLLFQTLEELPLNTKYM
jgi:hypothetical protein